MPDHKAVGGLLGALLIIIGGLIFIIMSPSNEPEVWIAPVASFLIPGGLCLLATVLFAIIDKPPNFPGAFM